MSISWMTNQWNYNAQDLLIKDEQTSDLDLGFGGKKKMLFANAWGRLCPDLKNTIIKHLKNVCNFSLKFYLDLNIH